VRPGDATVNGQTLLLFADEGVAPDAPVPRAVASSERSDSILARGASCACSISGSRSSSRPEGCCSRPRHAWCLTASTKLGTIFASTSSSWSVVTTRFLKLVPLEPGSLRVAAASAWMKLLLPGQNPSRLHLSAILREFVIDFPNGRDPQGSATGTLSCAVTKGDVQPEDVQLSGPAYLDSEYFFEGDATSPENTARAVRVELGLKLAGSVPA
jgi:hypothetical protein